MFEAIIVAIVLLLPLTVAYIHFSHILKSSTQDAVNSLQLQSCTNTNNNYPPMGDVLAQLDENIRGDMRGYMGDICDEQ